MYIKFSIINRLLVTLVVTSLLLFPTFGVSAGNNTTNTTIPAKEMNILSSSQGVPPPLGPPAPQFPFKELRITRLTFGSVIGPTDVENPQEEIGLEDIIQKIVDDLNAEQAKATSGVRAKVSWSFQYIGSPSMWRTEYSNRPNEHFVRIPYMIDYHVYDIQIYIGGVWVDVGLERHIKQSIDIEVFCSQWHTGRGRLKVVGRPDQPYLSDPGTLEDVVDFFLNGYLSDYIDSLLRKRLPSLHSSSGDLPEACDALGSYNDSRDMLDLISWSYHPRSVPQIPTAYDQISVILTSIKRLVAHDQGQTVLYDVMEAPDLTMYVNHRFASIQLPRLLEGQQVSLNVPILMTKRPADTEFLVVIANVMLGSPGSPLEDSAFRVFTSSTDFGKGTQTLIIQKSYWTKFDPRTGVKPYERFVDAYELTFQVKLLEGADH